MSSASPVALSAASLEAQHQAEMIRIHEAWQQTKADLAEARNELLRAQAAGGPGERDAAMEQLQALTVELRDKCRFTELQLAGTREECTKLAASADELRRQLADSQQQMLEMQQVSQQQSPVILELQAQVQRLGREKQEAEHRLREEQRTRTGIDATSTRLWLRAETVVASLAIAGTFETQAQLDGRQSQLQEQKVRPRGGKPRPRYRPLSGRTLFFFPAVGVQKPPGGSEHTTTPPAGGSAAAAALLPC